MSLCGLTARICNYHTEHLAFVYLLYGTLCFIRKDYIPFQNYTIVQVLDVFVLDGELSKDDKLKIYILLGLTQ